MGKTLQQPESHFLCVGGQDEDGTGQGILHTGLIPEDVPVEGTAKECELFLGFERNVRSRRDSLLV